MRTSETITAKQIDWLAEARQRVVVSIGQIDAKQRRALDRAAQRGEILKWQGFWNNPLGSIGLGRPRACFGPLYLANQVAA